MKQRLHKILARTTSLSLRAAEKAILAGEVSVNGQKVTKLGSLVDGQTDDIKWKGKSVHVGNRPVYIIYNKPKGELVTKRDPQGRPTIWKNLGQWKNNVNAAGRLDYDSEGLLILTSDGGLINMITHPSHNICKVYRVKVKGFPEEERLDLLRKGLKKAGLSFQPAKVKVVYKAMSNAWVEAMIWEGKYRQVKRMFEAIGYPVLKLKRIAVGSIKLGKLETGAWRFLKQSEKDGLLKDVGLKKGVSFSKKSHRR